MFFVVLDCPGEVGEASKHAGRQFLKLRMKGGKADEISRSESKRSH